MLKFWIFQGSAAKHRYGWKNTACHWEVYRVVKKFCKQVKEISLCHHRKSKWSFFIGASCTYWLLITSPQEDTDLYSQRRKPRSEGITHWNISSIPGVNSGVIMCTVVTAAMLEVHYIATVNVLNLCTLCKQLCVELHTSRKTRSAYTPGVRIFRFLRLNSIVSTRITYTSNMAMWFYARFNGVTAP